MKAQSSALLGPDLVTLALFQLGGADHVVDTEDVAMRVAKLAPGRFAWRKYPEQVDLEHVRVVLSDAKKARCGTLVSGTGKTGWGLTQAGLKRATELDQRAPAAAAPPRAGRYSPETAWVSRERARLLSTAAFGKATAGQPLTPRDAEQFFRVDEYVSESARQQRVVRLLAAFASDPGLVGVIRRVADHLEGAR